MEKIRVFNTSVEIGVRILVILNESRKALDLQQLIYYDFLVLHYGDVSTEHTSLHPSNPLHSTEFIVKRKVIQEAIKLVARKGLLSVIYSNTGILYQANDNTSKFLEYFESSYFIKLRHFANLVASRFENYSEVELRKYFMDNFEQWKGEFEKEALFRGEGIE